jgi:serine/threonine protein kinase/tetratricopeptide (TPR) repeat protein/TolB-like protein
MAPETPIVGRVLGHYRVLEQIGAGGMGLVFRASDQQLERDVAIKVLSRGMLADEEARKRFRHEALALAKLNHPNIGTVYEFGSHEGQDFLVMEYVDGGAIDAKLATGPLSQKEVLRTGFQLADGLASAHEHGVIHRDLKPANLRLTRDNRLKILDFGLAQFVRQEGDLSVTASISEGKQPSGTLPYMSPEQLRGEVADQGSDIWSAGAVLYELATGRRPFAFSQVPLLIDAILNKPPENPSALNPKISPGLEMAILKCLDKDPERRYQSARELRVDLDRLTMPVSGVPSAPAPAAPIPSARSSGTVSSLPVSPSGSGSNRTLEMAHVLFTDIVAYSRLPMDQQEQALLHLQEAVRETQEFARAQASDQLIRLPTGDGMALVFLGDVEAPVRCALELHRILRRWPEMHLRMGIHTGPVYRVQDINAARNVAGGGINIAQRVMDCGDAGHILISKTVADVLDQVSTWNAALHDLGEAEVKHGLCVHLYNLYTDEAGNRELPQKLRVAQTTAATARSQSKRKKLSLGVVAAGVIVALMVGGFLYFRHPLRISTQPPLKQRRTVAVLNFKNATSRPESAWLSTALPEMLTTELAAGEKLRTITGDEVAQMMNLSPPNSDSLTAQTSSQVGKSLGADLVVVGSYVVLPGGKLRLDLHLQDVAAGETLLSVNETGEQDDLFDLVSHAGAQLREKCGVGQVNPQDEAGVRAALPSNPEASRFYAEGLAELRVGDAIAARDLLQKAVAADPTHALAHSALAAAWALLGYDEKARLSSKSAYELSASLSREDRLLTEARYRETTKEWGAAAESYRALFKFFPDDLEYGLLLAGAQMHGGKGKEALATVESLRRLPPPAGSDPRIDLAASEAWRSLGDFKQGQAFAKRAAQEARTQNAKLLLARALYLQGSILENLGDPNGAMAAVEESGRIYQSVGDRNGLASTIEVTGQVLEDRGDYPGALGKFNDELAVAREVGNRRAESSALNNMALVLSQQGDAEQARKMYEKAGSIFREISDHSNYAMTLINIAGIKQNEGDLAGAKKTYDEVHTLFSEINDQNGIALSLTGIGTVLDGQGDSAGAKKVLEQAIALDLAGQTNPSTDKLIGLGDALQHLGDLPGARKKYEDALALARAAGDKRVAAYALAGLGSLALTAADFAQARKDYEDALASRNDLGEKDNIAATRVALAELAIEEGHPGAAEGPAREARDEFQRAHRSDDQITASTILVGALLAEDEKEEAIREAGKTAPLATKSQNLSVQLAFTLARARAEAASQEMGAAKTILKEALAKATRSGYVGDQLESRLALEEIEVKSGKSAASRARLEQLQKDAKEKGFDLIARNASKL